MSNLFGGKKPQVSVEQQKAQRRQNESIERQTADEAREAGARSRNIQKNRQGGSLFAKTGAAGVKEKLGG